MSVFSKGSGVGVIAAAAMGSGIAQVAAVAGHKVMLYDTNSAALEKAKASLTQTINKLTEKGKITNAEEVLSRFTFTAVLEDFKSCGLVIEAIIENLEVK